MKKKNSATTEFLLHFGVFAGFLIKMEAHLAALLLIKENSLFSRVDPKESIFTANIYHKTRETEMKKRKRCIASEKPSHFSDIPADILMHVFSILPLFQRMRLRLVCKKWNVKMRQAMSRHFEDFDEKKAESNSHRVFSLLIYNAINIDVPFWIFDVPITKSEGGCLHFFKGNGNENEIQFVITGRQKMMEKWIYESRIIDNQSERRVLSIQQLPQFFAAIQKECGTGGVILVDKAERQKTDLYALLNCIKKSRGGREYLCDITDEKFSNVYFYCNLMIFLEKCSHNKKNT